MKPLLIVLAAINYVFVLANAYCIWRGLHYIPGHEVESNVASLVVTLFAGTLCLFTAKHFT